MGWRKCDGRRVGRGIVAALALLAGGTAFAQDGDRDRGRSGFDPGEMVRRMDVNGNGTLEPSEMEGRSGRFLQRIADEERIDLSRGVSVADMERRIRARMPAPSSGPPPGSPPGAPQGGPPTGGPPGSGPGSPPGSGSSLPSRSAPLVPGFGEKAPTGGPAGFGGAPGSPQAGGSSSGRPTALGADPESVREAERMVSRYDRNKSGALEKEEWKDVTWSSDPNTSDLNRDGILSKDELIARMDAKRKGVSQTPAGGSSVAAAPGGKPDDRMVKYAESLMSQNDANRNGILERDEWKGLRGDPGEYDLNRDGLISKDELMARLAKYSSGGDRGDSGRGGDFGRSGGSSKGSSSAASLRKTERFLSPLERLPKGLPDWFTRSDANRDGQVMMHEFSSTWSDAKAIEFAALDLDGDGIITPRECLAKQVKK